MGSDFLEKEYKVLLTEDEARKLHDLEGVSGFCIHELLRMAVSSFLEGKQAEGSFVLFLKSTGQWEDAKEALRNGDTWELENLYCAYSDTAESYLLDGEEAQAELEEAVEEEEVEWCPERR